ncbi:MAG: hypothetical protein V4857_24715 [Pseudomonadota bacterium]
MAIWLLQFLAELLLNIVAEALVELGLRSAREPFRRPQPNPWLAAIGYCILGAAAGALSLWLFPIPFIGSQAGRIANLIATPLAAGAVMAAMGAWRRRRGEELLRIDRFAYGFLFALSMTVVRFVYTHG